MPKVRADQLLVKQGLCESRSLAQRLIMAGEVRIGSDQVVAKAGQLLPEDTSLRINPRKKYVSRGAFKLIPALEKYDADLSGKIGLDLGASTGGFTEVMLEHGVQKVYAVDVGYGQLHDKLRRDDRVISMERTNARNLTSELIPEKIDILTGDVSFISLTKVLPPCVNVLKKGAFVFVLIKPQFEAERQEVNAGSGVIRDEAIRQRCVDKILAFVKEELQWTSLDVLPSPIQGPKGNQEYVAVFQV
ncbi:MAG: TlyA family RNA methyltransferase [Lentisphaeria bacterium]